MRSQIVKVSLLALIAASCGAEDRKERRDGSHTEATVADTADTPAYLVFNYEIQDREAYDPYLEKVPATLEAYGAEVLIADFDSDAIEGDAGDVTVVLKFASEEIARRWYKSPEYQKIIELRTSNSAGISALASNAKD